MPSSTQGPPDRWESTSIGWIKESVPLVANSTCCLTESLCVVLVVFWFVLFLLVTFFSRAGSPGVVFCSTMGETSGAVFNCRERSRLGMANDIIFWLSHLKLHWTSFAGVLYIKQKVLFDAWSCLKVEPSKKKGNLSSICQHFILHRMKLKPFLLAQLSVHFLSPPLWRAVNNLNKLLDSKGTVVLRRWESGKWKLGFIKRVDKSQITTVRDLESWRFEH